MSELHVNDIDALNDALAEAQARIEADRQEREQRCIAGIQEWLRRERCDLLAVAFLTDDGRIGARPQVRAR